MCVILNKKNYNKLNYKCRYFFFYLKYEIILKNNYLQLKNESFTIV
jgi:hypothetical protein